MMNVSKLRPAPVENDAQTIETITPAKAKEYLATRVANRLLSQSKTVEYGLAMERDDWVLNGETVKFDREGHLFDGQHRLEACILAEKPFRTYVVRGLADPRAMATVDVGKNRTHTDVWTIAGCPNAALTSATATMIYLYQHGHLSWSGMKATRVVRRDSVILQKIKQMPQAAGNVSKEKLLAFAQPIMDDIVQSAHVIASIKLRGIIPPSAAAAMIFLSKRKPEAAQFVKDIVTGAGLARGDPAYTLREHLLNRQRMGGKLHKSYVFGMMIKMFNKRMENEKVGAIRLSEGEKFPKLAA